MRLPLVDPEDEQAVGAAPNEQLMRSAEVWLSRGARSTAVDLCEIILRRDAAHAEALLMLAHLTAEENINKGHRLFLQAERQQDLSARDYRAWISALLSAEAPRIRQAADVARRMHDTFREDPESLAESTFWLAKCGEFEAAGAALKRLSASPDLTESMTDWLVPAVGILAEPPGTWAENYTVARDTLSSLRQEGGIKALYTLVWLAIQHEEWVDAEACLDELDQRISVLEKRSDPQSASADKKFLRALSEDSMKKRAWITALSDRVDTAVHLFQKLGLDQAPPDATVEDAELRVGFAGALHAAGRTSEAMDILHALTTAGRLGDTPPAGGATEAAKRKAVLLEAEIRLAQLRYDRGDFTGCWMILRSRSIQWRDEELPMNMRATMLGIHCRIERSPRDVFQDFEGLRLPDGWNSASGRAVEIARLETLSWLSHHATGFATMAESSLRDALAVLRHRGGRKRDISDRAYIALLVGDHALAWELLSEEGRSDIWRIRAMQAHAALGLHMGDEAYELCGELLDERPHDLNVRCMFIEAALLAGHGAEAVREAESLVRYVPDDVYGHLLLAECLEPEKSAPDSSRRQGYQDLIYATHHYAESLRLHDGLRSSLTGGAPERAGSDLLTNEAVAQASRKGAQAAIRAASILFRAGLPADPALLKDGYELVERLRGFDPEEATRFRQMLDAPDREQRRRRRSRVVVPASGLVFLVLLVILDLTTPHLEGLGAEARISLFVLCGLALVWPYARKLNFPGGFGMERLEEQPPVEVDSALIGNGLVSAQSWLHGMIAPISPPAIQLESQAVPSPHATGGLDGAAVGSVVPRAAD